ncbi:MAG: TolC family protein [Prevotellaceae bacterium]|nr:TolC family protein [Prevotellaceae bacterium]
MKKLIFILLLCAGNSFAQDTIRLTLQDAIHLAVEKSIDAKIAKNQLLAAYWQYRSYRRELLPQLTFSGTLPEYSRSLNMYQNEDGSYKYINSDYNRFNGGLSLTQNIPWTGATLSASTSYERLQQYNNSAPLQHKTTPVAISLEQPILGFNNFKWLLKTEPLRYSAAQKQAVVDQEEVALTVIGHYFGLLSEEINLEITRQNMSNAQRLYTIAEARHRMGLVPNVELMQMRSALLSAEIALTDGQFSLDNRMFNLRSFLGLKDGTVIIPFMPEFVADSVPQFSFGEVLEQAQKNNPFTENLRRSLIEADRDVSQARANRWSMSLYANFGMSGQDANLRSAYNANRWENDQSASIGIRVPILDWGKGKGQVKMAEANREITHAQVEKQNLDFTQNIYLMVQNFNSQPRQLELAKYMDEMAQQRYKSSVELYVLEKIDVLNLTDSEKAKDQARRSYINEVLLLWQYYYQLRALTLYDFIARQPIALLYEVEN